jgi:hypothetical protein
VIGQSRRPEKVKLLTGEMLAPTQMARLVPRATWRVAPLSASSGFQLLALLSRCGLEFLYYDAIRKYSVILRQNSGV